jgi:hypothetical protein
LYLKLWLPVWFTDTYDNVYHIYRSIVLFDFNKLENTEGAIKKRTIQKTWQHIYIYGTQNEEKQNTICVGHHYMQITNTNNVHKTCTLPQTNNSCFGSSCPA